MPVSSGWRIMLTFAAIVIAFVGGLQVGFVLRHRETRQAFEIVDRQRKLINKLTEQIPGDKTLNLRSWVND